MRIRIASFYELRIHVSASLPINDDPAYRLLGLRRRPPSGKLSNFSKRLYIRHKETLMVQAVAAVLACLEDLLWFELLPLSI